MKKDVKVKVELTEGFRERFTEACVKVAKKRVESLQGAQKEPQKAAV